MSSSAAPPSPLFPSKGGDGGEGTVAGVPEYFVFVVVVNNLSWIGGVEGCHAIRRLGHLKQL